MDDQTETSANSMISAVINNKHKYMLFIQVNVTDFNDIVSKIRDKVMLLQYSKTLVAIKWKLLYAHGGHDGVASILFGCDTSYCFEVVNSVVKANIGDCKYKILATQ